MAPPRRPLSPPVLVDELIAEILLRVPPDEPAHLVRASLVCKPWLRLLSDSTFLRRYREFYRTPPLLGFLHSCSPDNDDLALREFYVTIARFVPTTTASPLASPALGCSSSWVLDCRHGRVLIYTLDAIGLVVWDPITGDEKQVPMPEYPHTFRTAAVLCAVVGCDHLDCCGGPFLVVFVGTDDAAEMETWASVYSSETNTWSALTTIDLYPHVEMRPSHLIGNALYFILKLSKGILKYDLGERSLSVLDPPKLYGWRLSVLGQPELYEQSSIVMTAEDGALGFAGMEGRNLYLWSWKDVNEDVTGWVLRRVIKLDELIPIGNLSLSPDVIGSVEGTHTIFIGTDDGVFMLDLKSKKVRKVSEKVACIAVVPYTSFYAPVHAMDRLLSP